MLLFKYISLCFKFQFSLLLLSYANNIRHNVFHT
jgi:hypothetical protein